jgi:hypothetical protein
MVEEGTTQVITGAVKLIYNLGHYITDNLEIRRVHAALLQLVEVTIPRNSKLNNSSVTAHCRFICNCRQFKANRQYTTLIIQDLD